MLPVAVSPVDADFVKVVEGMFDLGGQARSAAIEFRRYLNLCAANASNHFVLRSVKEAVLYRITRDHVGFRCDLTPPVAWIHDRIGFLGACQVPHSNAFSVLYPPRFPITIDNGGGRCNRVPGDAKAKRPRSPTICQDVPAVKRQCAPSSDSESESESESDEPVVTVYGYRQVKQEVV